MELFVNEKSECIKRRKEILTELNMEEPVGYKGFKVVDGRIQYLVRQGRQHIVYQDDPARATVFMNLRELWCLAPNAGITCEPDATQYGNVWGCEQCVSALRDVFKAFDGEGRLHGSFQSMAWGDPRWIHWDGHVPLKNIVGVSWLTGLKGLVLYVTIDNVDFSCGLWDGANELFLDRVFYHDTRRGEPIGECSLDRCV